MAHISHKVFLYPRSLAKFLFRAVQTLNKKILLTDTADNEPKQPSRADQHVGDPDRSPGTRLPFAIRNGIAQGSQHAPPVIINPPCNETDLIGNAITPRIRY